MRRRVFAVLALVTMTSTTLVGPAAACTMVEDIARHPAASAEASIGAEGPHHHHSAERPAPASEAPPHDPSHEQPGPLGCQSLAACASAVETSAAVAAPAAPPLGARIAAQGVLPPESRIVAPDTPPPKA